MFSMLAIWLQIGPFFPSGTQIAQDLRLFPGYRQDAWVGYRAQRQGRVHLYLHHTDSSGYSHTSLSGWCVSAGDTLPVLAWDGYVSNENAFYGGFLRKSGLEVFCVMGENRFLWRDKIPHTLTGGDLRVWGTAGQGFFTALLANQALFLYGYTTSGEKRLSRCIDSLPVLKRHLTVLSGNSEGFWLLWEAYQGKNWTLMAQRWSSEGQPLMPPQVLPVGPGRGKANDGALINATIHSAYFIDDGYGGFFGVYESSDLQSAGKDLYLVRYNRHAQKLYEVPLCIEPGDQEAPKLYKRGTELLIVWEDSRRQDWDLYYQRVEIGTGRRLLAPEGAPLITLPGPQRRPHLLLDYFQNEAIIVWEDMRHLQSDVYYQRISADGKPLWEFGGRPLVTNPHAQHHLLAYPQDFQSFWVAYLEDLPLQGTHPYLLHVRNESPHQSIPLYGSHEAFATLSRLKTQPWGESLVLTWQDTRNNAKKPQIYLQRLSPTEEPLWSTDGLPASLQLYAEERVADLITVGDTLWLLWQAYESDVEVDLFAQGFTPMGQKLFQRPVPVCIADRVQTEARWFLQKGALYATWTDNRSMEETGFDLYYRPVQPLSPEVGWRSFPSFQSQASYIPIDTARLHHLWSEAVGDVYQVFYGIGALGLPMNPQAIRPSGKPQRFASHIRGSDGTLFVSFCEEAPGPYQQMVVLLSISREGRLLWAVEKSLPFPHALYPKLTWWKNNQLLLTALVSPAPGSWELAYALYDAERGQHLSTGVLLGPVPERLHWQPVVRDETLWLLTQMPTGWVLYKGPLTQRLKPHPLPHPPAEAQLILWHNRLHLFWIDQRRTHIRWQPLESAP